MTQVGLFSGEEGGGGGRGVGGSRDTIKRSRDFQNISESLNMKKLFTKCSYMNDMNTC